MTYCLAGGLFGDEVPGRDRAAANLTDQVRHISSGWYPLARAPVSLHSTRTGQVIRRCPRSASSCW